MSHRPSRRALIALPLAGLLVACVSETQPDAPAICENFSVTFATIDVNSQPKSTFAPGEAVRFLGRVTNDSAQSLVLTAANGCVHVNFAVDTAAGQNLWHSLDNETCTQALRAETYAAGESKTFTGSWNQLRRDGTAAPAGSYRARLVDSTECRDAFARSLPFTIQ
jgi:hypothetical protein